MSDDARRRARANAAPTPLGELARGELLAQARRAAERTVEQRDHVTALGTSPLASLDGVIRAEDAAQRRDRLSLF